MMTTIIVLILSVILFTSVTDAAAWRKPKSTKGTEGQMMMALSSFLENYPIFRDISRGFVIYTQYFSDQQADDKQYLNPQYHASWDLIDFNVEHYKNLTRPSLKYYFEVNNDDHYDIVNETMTYFWRAFYRKVNATDVKRQQRTDL